MLTRGLARSARAASRQSRELATATRPALARILLGDPTDPVCESVFKSRGHDVDCKPGLSKAELLEVIGQYDGLVVRSGVQVDADVIAAAKQMRIVGRAGTGVDNIDVPAATSKGVLVMNTPGGNTISTAELAMSHILALARNIPSAVASMKAGRWDRKKYMGTELMGKTIGVVGLGRIGREVAGWCSNFGMHAIGYDPLLTDAGARAAGIEPVSLDHLFERSDFITIHSPLTPETKNLIGRANLAKCKRGVRIVNCARGGIVNPHDLLEALESGQVAGASLDVYPAEPPLQKMPELEPLVTHPRVICTPHLGASTKDAQIRVARDIAVQMCDVLDGGEYVGVLNAPNMAFVRKSKLTPFVRLGEKMGSLQAQLLGPGKVRSMKITLHGTDLAVAEMTGPMTAAVLKGALSELLVQQVNFINAVALAKDIGLQIEVALAATDPAGYTNAITVEFELEGVLNGRRSLSGTCFGRDIRITAMDGLDVDFHPTGSLLFFNNPDVPGMLKKVSDVLADNSINIANFALGRVRTGGTAMSCITVDGAIPDHVMEELRKVPDIRNVMQVKMVEAVDPSFRVDEEEVPLYDTPMPPNKPVSPHFSSGPCKKRPGYALSLLNTDCLGRSHRSKIGKARLRYAIDETRRILGVPDDYLIGIVPASDTGAYEMAMWNMLGPRPVDACFWESFGKGWATDAVSHLGMKDMTTMHSADYGLLPDLSQTSPDNDILFTWNGTTSGVRVPDANWIADDRKGLTFNDATSAAFAMDIPWDKVDVTTYSWQKVLGGEGAHGVLILSPRAVERLETFVPDNRPLPKIFRMTKKGKVDRSIFEGATINTPSMLCVEDYVDALNWADSIGGLPGLIRRSTANLKVVEDFVEKNDWVDFLAKDPATRSSTSVCLSVDLNKDEVKKMVSLLEKEGVAYDVGSYRDAPPGLRIWCGATVDKEDVEALMPWLEWAFTEAKQ